MKNSTLSQFRFAVATALLCALPQVRAATLQIVYGNNASFGPDITEKFTIDKAGGTASLLQSYNTNSGNGRGVVVVGDTLYTTNANEGIIWKNSVSTGLPLGSIAVNGHPGAISTLAWDGNAFWAADYSGAGGTAYQINTSGDVIKTIPLANSGGFSDGLEWFNGKLIANRGDADGIYDVYDLDGNLLQPDFFHTVGTGAQYTGVAYDGTDFIVSDIFNSQLKVFDGVTGNFIKDIPLTDPTISSAGRLIEDLSIDYAQRDDTGNNVPETGPTLALLGIGAISLFGMARFVKRGEQLPRPQARVC